MKLRHLAIASAMVVVSAAGVAAPGDEVASSGFSCNGAACNGYSTGVDPGPGLFNWEVSVTTTGLSFLSSIKVNGVQFTTGLPGKSFHESGVLPFSGPFTLGVYGATLSQTQPFNFGGSFTITQAVPEPETYAMLLAGLGVIGFIAKRRNLG